MKLILKNTSKTNDGNDNWLTGGNGVDINWDVSGNVNVEGNPCNEATELNIVSLFFLYRVMKVNIYCSNFLLSQLLHTRRLLYLALGHASPYTKKYYIITILVYDHSQYSLDNDSGYTVLNYIVSTSF